MALLSPRDRREEGDFVIGPYACVQRCKGLVHRDAHQFGLPEDFTIFTAPVMQHLHKVTYPRDAGRQAYGFAVMAQAVS
ncbi:hypothetical protein BGC30_08675 [Novacetimonas hansenii]|nr:hypothetical protein BGC30_08675 [Novacetimonas hansenii]